MANNYAAVIKVVMPTRQVAMILFGELVDVRLAFINPRRITVDRLAIDVPDALHKVSPVVTAKLAPGFEEVMP